MVPLKATEMYSVLVVVPAGVICVAVTDEDADLDEAIRGILYSAFGFSGQKCSACSRLIVVGSAYEPLLERLKDAVQDLIVAQAKDPSAYLGPVVDQEAYERIKKTIAVGKAELSLLAEGMVPAGGHFIPPTIFRDVPLSSPLWKDEIFGPVVTISPFSTEEQVIEWANGTPYGLSASIWTENGRRQRRVAEQLCVGTVWVNCWMVRDLNMPFGGVKQSGIGREGGDYSMEFFMDEKCICLAN
jgi:acyl-CoA reductase-like NAD-dependent aldehyde dehydrogenase